MNKFKVLAIGAVAAMIFSTGSIATHATASTTPSLTANLTTINLAQRYYHRGLVKCYFSGYKRHGYRRYVRWSAVGYSRHHAYRKGVYYGNRYGVRHIRFHGCRYYGRYHHRRW